MSLLSPRSSALNEISGGPSAPDAANRSYRPDIDGLRAIAIVGVVLYHAGVSWVSGGFSGVDIFFVISGYLIGGHIFSELLAGKFSYLRFYQRRAKRILPAFYVVLLFTIAASLVLLSPPEAKLFGRAAFASTLSASNIVFWHNSKYFDTRSELIPLLMTWSLAVEEQFYAVIPVLMVLLAKVRRNWILPAVLALCAVSLGIAEFQLSGRSQAAFQAAFYLLPARAWELGAGVALAIAEIGRRGAGLRTATLFAQTISVIGVALMVAPIFLLNTFSPFPGVGALPSILGTVLVIATAGSWINRRVLSLAPLVFVGRVSYSWYLWHWPLLAFLHILYGNKLPLALSLLTVAVAFVLSVLTYYLVEQPFRKTTRAAKPMLLRYAAVSVVLVLVCAGIWLSKGVPQRYPLLARMEAADQPLWFDTCLVDDDAAKPNLASGCYDRSENKPAVAIWGDSHAAALSPGMRSVAMAQGYDFLQFTKTTCLPLSGVVRYIPRMPEHAERCISFNRQVLDIVKNDPRVRMVILTGEWSACFERSWEGGWLSADTEHPNQIPSVDTVHALFVQALQAQIHALRAAGKYVVVMEDVPNFDPDPLWRVRNAHIPFRTRLAAQLGVQNAGDPGFAPNNLDASVDALAESSLRVAVSSQPGTQLADLKPALCTTSSRCAYRDGEHLLYFDSGHLTGYGARYAVRGFRLPALPSETTSTAAAGNVNGPKTAG